MTATPLTGGSPSHSGQHGADSSNRNRGRELPMDVSEAFVADILKPYRPNAKYLKSAQITQFRESMEGNTKRVPLVTAKGRFSIPESCYIDDTGHFNAVEFNICYNQLAYVMFGKCFDTGIVQKLKFLSLSEYKRHQLQSCYIVSLDSRFFKPLKSDAFEAELILNKMSAMGGALFCFTAITFSDVEGDKAQGSVVLAFNPPVSLAKH